MTDYQLFHGDCLDILPTLEAGSVDAVITDPPYGLGFMGKDWDHGVPGERFWAEVLRVAKPGAFLLAFGGTRTFHRLAVAIEDAGWEIRDCVMWVYGSGFPKSHDISKAIDKAAGAEREVLGVQERQGRSAGILGTPVAIVRDITAPATDAARQWDGWGTALKPAWEPVIVAMKPTEGTFAENALRHGVAGLNIDGSRVEVSEDDPVNNATFHANGRRAVYGNSALDDTGSKVSIKPKGGRWPANIIHDGSEEVLAGFPMAGGGYGKRGKRENAVVGNFGMSATMETVGYGDTGSAARFFYCAKASRAERDEGLEGLAQIERDSHNLSSNACGRCGLRVKANGSGKKCECGDLRETIKLPPARNHHPTVKPIELMRYLCKLTATPTGGVVLDPFMGSGSTGVAAIREGRDFVGIEMDAEYLEIARRRIEHAAQMAAGQFVDKRGKAGDNEDLPLFGVAN